MRGKDKRTDLHMKQIDFDGSFLTSIPSSFLRLSLRQLTRLGLAVKRAQAHLDDAAKHVFASDLAMIPCNNASIG